MPIPSLQTVVSLQSKARELGVREEMIASALHLISQSRNLVNALDNTAEMDEYIYRDIIMQAFDKRKQEAEQNLESNDTALQTQAARDLVRMSREELVTDPFYRAVLPLMVRIMNGQPILRLHAEVASTIVLELAEVKRRHRATSFTEVIVKRCSQEIESAYYRD